MFVILLLEKEKTTRYNVYKIILYTKYKMCKKYKQYQ